MRIKLLFIVLFMSSFCFAQQNNQLSTIDFVKVLNNNKEEVVYYYNHNWKILREMALKKGYIASYQFLETSPSEKAPFSFILITTYPNQEQYDLREKHFAEVIKEKGALQLMNDKKPADFRENLYNKEGVKHLN